jgi:hypothetical protein
MDKENKFGKKFGELLLILCCVVFMRFGDVLFYAAYLEFLIAYLTRGFARVLLLWGWSFL